MSQVQSKNFRYDINALRAIAIIGVTLFHYKVKWFDGGFAGVDIFFVISGYLMTRIIANGIERNAFSFTDFYGKRLRRIVPALIALIVLLTVACFFIYFPAGYKLNEKNSAASLLFVSNILYWQTSNYFAAASDDNILLHTWSLSVEWQFYMLYPLILIVIFKFFKGKLRLFLSLSGLIFISFLSAFLWGRRDPTASFYLLPTRAWEMMFGGLAFLGEDFFTKITWRKYIAILGYIINFLCLILLYNGLQWPGLFTLIPVVATFLIIISNCNNFSVLRNPVVQFIGKISYSLYLWHWPVYVIASYVGFELTIWSTVIMLSIATLLGYLSFKFVESNNYQFNKPILIGGGALVIITALLSTINSNVSIFKPSTVALEGYSEMHEDEKEKQFEGHGCFIGSKKESAGLNEAECLKIDNKKHNVLLIGDSHAAQFSQSFREILADKNINILQATASGCLPVSRPNGQRRCQTVMKLVYDRFLLKYAKDIDGVIICANWINNGNKDERLINDLENTLKYFNKYHINAIIIGQNETYDMTYSLIAARENEYNVKVADKYIYERAAKVNNYLDNHFNNYVNIYNVISGVLPGNVPYMFDRNHYSKPAADLVVKKILKDTVAQRFFASVGSNDN